MAYSCFKLFQVSILSIFIALINIQVTLTQVTSTTEQSVTESGTTLSSVSATLAANEVLVSSTEAIPNNKNTAVVAQEKSHSPALFPSFTFNLTDEKDERIKLTVSPSESTVEFRVSFERKELINSTVPSSSNKTLASVKDAQRFLIAFENDHFNLDVISVPLTKDASGKVAFGNAIEDFSWNKKNGIMLRDSTQNYKWISSGAKEDGSELFVTFSRDWLTCDEQDIQFTLSSLKVWWLIDTNNSSSSSALSQEKTSSHKMFEKQEAAVGTDAPNADISSVPSVSPSATESPAAAESSQSSPKPVEISTQSTLPVAATSIPISKEPNFTKSTSTEPTTTATTNKPLSSSTVSSLEVEVLKSIADLKFQGPVNISLQPFIMERSSVYLKACDDSLNLFHCNKSTFTPEMISTSRHFLYIWRLIITGNNSNSNNSSVEPLAKSDDTPEFHIQPCSKILDLIKQIPTYHAFSGNRTPKSHIPPSKNSATTACTNIINSIYVLSFTYVNILITHVLFTTKMNIHNILSV